MNRITVAICTWNRGDLLDQTLTRMHQLSIPDGVEWELLVVNNNCTDYTDDVIARHAEHLPIRRLFERTPGKSHAANLAIENASGELILWTDDDVLVAPDWLAAAVAASNRHPEAAGFGGPIDPWFVVTPDPRLVAAFPIAARGFCGLDHEMDESPLQEDQPVYGANMAFRRSALGDLRFNPLLGPLTGASINNDDTEFISRVRARGGQLIWVPTLRVRHFVDPDRMKLRYILSYYEDMGNGLVRFHGVAAGPRLFGVPRWLLRNWLEASLRSALYCMAPYHFEALTWRRSAHYYTGMIKGCLTLRDATNTSARV